MQVGFLAVLHGEEPAPVAAAPFESAINGEHMV